MNGETSETTVDGQAQRARPETNRERVRRLLFGPLGFRWPRAVDPGEGAARLDAIADDLAYMGDEALGVLARMLRVQGQGSARNFWPDRATFVGFAHVVQPLPLDSDPKLRSWFASVEGQRMVVEGTLVETWVYFERTRVPPFSPQAREMVRRNAAEAARRLQIVAERQAQGLGVEPAELRWAEWYRDLRARLESLVAEARAQRGAA